MRIGAEILLPIGLLGLVRYVLHVLGAQSWAEGLGLFPATGLWLWTVNLVVLATGILRLITVLQISRRSSPDPAPTGQTPDAVGVPELRSAS